jgi:cobalt-zinc-cadmium efflux system protein
MSEPIHQPKAHTEVLEDLPRHPRYKQKRQLIWVLVITGIVMIIEIAAGIWTQGLALLSDAFHLLAHFFGTGFTYMAIILAGRKAPPENTYRYWRFEILAALFNGLSLLAVVGFILWEAYGRFFDHKEIKTQEMLAVAAVGLVANILCAWLLKDSSKKDVNIRGAFLHMVADSVSSMGVIAAGLLVLWTGQSIYDPIAAVLISLLVLYWAIHLILDSCRVLLEAAPALVKIEDVASAMKEIKGVVQVHDIHLWVITSRMYSLTAHVVLDRDAVVSQTAGIAKEMDLLLNSRFDITHTCYQFEVDGEKEAEQKP